MDSMAASTLCEVVRAMLFFRVFEMAQYHTVNYKKTAGAGGVADSDVSCLVRAMTYTVGASHRAMPDLLTAAFFYKFLELAQLLVLSVRNTTKGGSSSWTSTLLGNLVTTVDMVSPREMFLMSGDRQQQSQSQQPPEELTQQQQEPEKPQQQQIHRLKRNDSAEVQVVSDSGVTKFNPDKCFSFSDHELPSITEEASENDGEQSFHNETDEEVRCSLLLPSSPAVASNKKKVAFSETANVYIFDMIVGDNPSASNGPPVQLSWSPRVHWKDVPLNKVHAVERTDQGFPRYVRRIPAERRRSILSSNGCFLAEISKAEKQAYKTFKNRCSTIQTMDKKQVRQGRMESVKELLFCFHKQDERYYKNDQHEPFLSTPQDLSGARTVVCRECARRCLEDTFKTSRSMYQCNGTSCGGGCSSKQLKNRSSWQTHMNSNNSVDSD